MAGKGQRREAAFPCVDAKLLVQFADQAGLWGLARLDLAAGEFPEPRHRPAFRAFRQQNPAISVDQRHSGDKEQVHWGRPAGFFGRLLTCRAKPQLPTGRAWAARAGQRPRAIAAMWPSYGQTTLWIMPDIVIRAGSVAQAPVGPAGASQGA